LAISASRFPGKDWHVPRLPEKCMTAHARITRPLRGVGSCDPDHSRRSCLERIDITLGCPVRVDRIRFLPVRQETAGGRSAGMRTGADGVSVFCLGHVAADRRRHRTDGDSLFRQGVRTAGDLSGPGSIERTSATSVRQPIHLARVSSCIPAGTERWAVMPATCFSITIAMQRATDATTVITVAVFP
jgi:hypothetical protein